MIISIHRAFSVMILLTLALTFTGCATTSTKLPPEEPAMHSVADFPDEDILHNDPWEGFNRNMYKFNYNFDKYVFLPVLKGYEFIMPNFAQAGLTNFFNNINEVRTFYNSLFQAKGKKSLTTLGRFATNTTIGVLGLFDPATSLGMKRQKEDFGQTLGVWGVPTGPYLVLPVLGPGTARSATGFVVDTAAHAVIKDAVDLPRHCSHEDTCDDIITGLSALKVINNRQQQPFRYHDSGYAFEYELIQLISRESVELQVMK